MLKKYLLLPGHIISKTDGERHYISARQLAGLYQVNMRDCYTLRIEDLVSRTGVLNGVDINSLIVLSPRYDGNYLPPNG